MKIKGQQTLTTPREQVWEALLDPGVLARALPGCQALDPVGENHYKIRMKLALAAVQGLFEGKILLQDVQPPDNYKLHIEGAGKVGFVNGEGHFHLEKLSDVETVVHYEGDVRIGGMIASVGQRLMDMTSKMMIRKFFASLKEILSEQ